MSWLFKDPVATMKEIMSWLFKDPFNSGLAQFDHANQTVKNGLKAKRIKLPQMNFVLEKQLAKFSCTYQPLPFCKIFIKKFLELIQSYEDVRHFWDQNSPFVLNKTFFWYKPLLLLSSTYGPFYCAKFKRNLTMNPELWRCTIFGLKVVHLLQI